MREIKFRVVNKYGKGEIGAMDYFTLKEGELFTEDDEQKICQMKEGTPYQQFTGLKDKKGKEIYEGDIVQGDLGDKSTIYWDESSVGFQGFPHGTQEIVGNIHENPELLNY